jgi:hypothetical protein
MTMILPLPVDAAAAASKTSRSFCSVSPWKGEESDGPAMEKRGMSREEAMAEARRVLPVPGGPWRRMPCGGCNPVQMLDYAC